MKLITTAQHQQLLENGRQQQALMGTDEERDFMPVVKLFTPDANATWLLTEIDPEQPDLAFGLCDLGLGFPELGSVSLTELPILIEESLTTKQCRTQTLNVFLHMANKITF